MGEGDWEKRKEGKLWLGCKINKFKIKREGQSLVYKGSSRKTSLIRSHLS